MLCNPKYTQKKMSSNKTSQQMGRAPSRTRAAPPPWGPTRTCQMGWSCGYWFMLTLVEDEYTGRGGGFWRRRRNEEDEELGRQKEMRGMCQSMRVRFEGEKKKLCKKRQSTRGKVTTAHRLDRQPRPSDHLCRTPTWSRYAKLGFLFFVTRTLHAQSGARVYVNTWKPFALVSTFCCSL